MEHFSKNIVLDSGALGADIGQEGHLPIACSSIDCATGAMHGKVDGPQAEFFFGHRTSSAAQIFQKKILEFAYLHPMCYFALRSSIQVRKNGFWRQQRNRHVGPAFRRTYRHSPGARRSAHRWPEKGRLDMSLRLRNRMCEARLQTPAGPRQELRAERVFVVEFCRAEQPQKTRYRVFVLESNARTL